MNCSIPGRGRRFLSSSVPKLALGPIQPPRVFPWGKSSHSVKLNTHLCLTLRLIKGAVTSLPPYSFMVDAEVVLSLPWFWCEHHVEAFDLRRLWKLCRFKVCVFFALFILHSCSPHILLSVSVVRLEVLCVCLCDWLKESEKKCCWPLYLKI